MEKEMKTFIKMIQKELSFYFWKNSCKVHFLKPGYILYFILRD